MTAPQPGYRSRVFRRQLTREPKLENLTHTLMGLAAGEAFAHCTHPAEEGGLPQTARRSLFVTLAAIGGNTPDLDLAWSYGSPDRRLGYMLEHRGYTHTVVGCLVLAALLYAGAAWWMRRRGLSPTRRDRLQLALVAVLGTLLHLGMDALNSYGVHPFWPFDNRWFYGDSIFIAEPLFWLASVPLIFQMRSGLARWLMSLVGVLALGASVFIHRGALPWEFGLVIASAALLAVGRLASARNAALTSAAAMALIIGTSMACGVVAAGRVETLANSEFPGDRTLDHILTPTLTDPRCWDVLLVGIQGDRYTLRHAVMSLAPGLVSATACPTLFARRREKPSGDPPGGTFSLPTAPPTSRVDVRDSAAIQWLGKYSMSRNQLIRLVRENCDAAAFAQFARAPFAFEYARSWLIGDLRFEGAGFQFEVRGGRCSIHVPWVPPRSDLLNPRSP
jgi:inner membrane protein